MEDIGIPDSGAVYTFGKTRFADNKPSQFFIKNDPIIDIACGDEFTIVLCQNGRLFSFGSNEYGQLGLGHKKTVNRPSCIKTLKPFKVKLIACGRSHSIAVNEYNHIYTFGNNSDGQLGQSNTIDKDIPTKIEDSPTKSNGKIVQVSAGSNHSAVLTEKGRLYIWGSNTEGQLGLSIDTKVEKITTPTMVAVPEKIIHISCGYYHSGFVTENGNAYTFGENENGKLGLNVSEKCVTKPTLLTNDNFKLKKIFCGGHHTFFISHDENLYSCGLNENGQLGIGDENVKVVSEPVIINKNILENSDIMNVSCGERHTAFVTKSGKLFTCGDSKYGKLCNLSETNDSEFSPKLVSQFENVKVCGASCGGCHTIVSIQKNNFQLKLDNIPSKLPALPPMSKKIEIPNIEDNFTNGKSISNENSIDIKNGLIKDNQEIKNSLIKDYQEVKNGLLKDNNNVTKLTEKYIIDDKKILEDDSQKEFEYNEECIKNEFESNTSHDTSFQEAITESKVEESSSNKTDSGSGSGSTSTYGETNSDDTKSQEQIFDIENIDEIDKTDKSAKTSQNKVTKFLCSFKRKSLPFTNKISSSKDTIIVKTENEQMKCNNETKSKTCSVL